MIAFRVLSIIDIIYKYLSDQIYITLIKQQRYTFLVEGLGVTLKLTLFGLIIGIVVGLLTAVVRIKKVPILTALSNTYVTIIRGTPITVQLIFIYFVVFASGDKLLAGSIAFGLNSGAYVSEIFRGGILAVDKGQMEAARTLGLSYKKAMRYIIIPQSIKNILPALGNEFIVLLKETSIAGYIALNDLTFKAKSIRDLTYEITAPLIIIAYTYLLMTLFIAKMLSLYERRLRSSD